MVPFLALLIWVCMRPVEDVAEEALLLPVFALVAMTVFVLVVAAVVRNVTLLKGSVSIEYFRSYRSGHPGERVERAAKIYDNLLQLPTLFYALCPLLMLTETVDSVFVSLAWLFVAARLAHAIVYFVWNAVPYRFAMFFVGLLTLVTLWGRFALAVT